MSILYVGTSSNETIYGSPGNDLLDGSGGQDSIRGGDGNDSLVGGAGNDTIDGENGNDTLLGGDGNDSLRDFSGANTLEGGDGDDFVDVGSRSSQQLVVGGNGADSINVRGLGGNIDAGGGNDYVYVSGWLDGSGVQNNSASVFGGNGNDNVNVDNLSFVSVDGGEGTDSINATVITRGVLKGGDGNDSVSLYFNSYNSNGTDGLQAMSEAYTIEGGSGDDQLSANGQAHEVGGMMSLLMRGDDGHDRLIISESKAGVFSQSKKNSADYGVAAATIEGGEGNDWLSVSGVLRATLAGGPGEDVFEITARQYRTLLEGPRQFANASGETDAVSPEPLKILDFQAGPGGDKLSLNDLFASVIPNFRGLNPFGANVGHLKLIQDGSDTLLQLDTDGSASTIATPVTIARLLGVTASSLTEENFDPSFHPNGSPAVGKNLVGTESSEVLSGGGGDDTLTGLGGDDSLTGGYGNDSLLGGPGNDVLNGGMGSDTLIGGDGNDFLSDHWYGQAALEYSSNRLEGGSGNDSFSVNNNVFGATQILLGGEGSDHMIVSASRASVYGGEGSDSLNFYATTSGSQALLMGDQGDDSLNLSNADQASLEGGDGTDSITVNNTRLATVYGGEGVDSIQINFDGGASGVFGGNQARAENYSVDGGDGDDFIQAQGLAHVAGGAMSITLDGGSGNDSLVIQRNWDIWNGGQDHAVAFATLRGGDGNDNLTITGVLQATMVGGEGRDRFHINNDQWWVMGQGTRQFATENANIQLSVSPKAIVIEDFTTGASGDVLALNLLEWVPIGYDGESNPFAEDNQYLKLTQEGSATVLSFDADGNQSSNGFVPLVQFQNTSVAAFTTENFRPGFSPSGSPSVGEFRVDGSDSSSLSMGAGPDTVDAGQGNDRVWGGFGADSISGGDGNDTLEGGPGDDRLNGGAGDDSLYDQFGANVLEGGPGNDFLKAGSYAAGHQTLNGDDGNDHLNIFARSASAAGGWGNDYIYFRAGNEWDSNRFQGTVLEAQGNEGSDFFSVWFASRFFIDAGPDDDATEINSSTTGTVEGGDGNDRITLNVSTYESFFNEGAESVSESYLLNGGSGNDTLEAFVYAHENGGAMTITLEGGEGDDWLTLHSTQEGPDWGIAYALLDAGSGNDQIAIRGALQATVTGGDGEDTFRLNGALYAGISQGPRQFANASGGTTPISSQPVVITDFNVAKDSLDVSDLLNFAAGYNGFNPFISGHLRVISSGSANGTLVQYDRDGAIGTDASWLSIANLQNVAPSSISSSNFKLTGNLNAIGIYPQFFAVNEGDIASFKIVAPNAPSGTQFDYRISGLSNSDLDPTIQLPPKVTIDSNGVATLDIKLKADALTEGSERIYLTVSPSSGQPGFGSEYYAQIRVMDTSAGGRMQLGQTQWVKEDRYGDTTKAHVSNAVATSSSDGTSVTVGALDGNAVITKTDQNGQVVWQRMLDAQSADSEAYCVAIGSDGTVYVGGAYTGALNGVVSGQAEGSAFLASIAANGAIQWLKPWGSAARAEAIAGITFDPAGRLLVAGNQVNASDTDKDFFVKLVSITGQEINQFTYTGSGLQEVNAIAASPDGKVYLAGITDSTFPNIPNNGFSSPVNGVAKAFLMALNPNLQPLSVHMLGTSANLSESAHSVKIGVDGAIYVAGSVQSGTWLDTISTGNDNNDYNDSQGQAAFVAKFLPSTNPVDGVGSPLWVRTIDSDGNDVAFSLSLSEGSVFVAGSTSGALQTQGGQGNFGGSDAFVSKLNADTGEILWTQQIGTPADDDGFAVAATSPTSVMLTGVLGGPYYGGAPYDEESPNSPTSAMLARVDELKYGSPIELRTEAVSENEIRIGIYLLPGERASSVDLSFSLPQAAPGLGSLLASTAIPGWIIRGNPATGEVGFGGTTPVVVAANGSAMRIAQLSFDPSNNPQPLKVLALTALSVDGVPSTVLPILEVADRSVELDISYWSGGKLDFTANGFQSQHGLSAQVGQAGEAVHQAQAADITKTFVASGLDRTDAQVIVSRAVADVAGAFDAEDALAALRLSVSLQASADVGGTTSPYQFIAADVNNDNRITSQDAVQILELATGLRQPIASQWVFLDQEKFETSNALNPIHKNRVTFDPSISVSVAVDDAQTSIVAVLKGDVSGYAFGVLDPSLTGTASNDTLNGTSAPNLIKGLAGDDLLVGRGGRDTLEGGSGNDTLDGGAGDDTLVGGTGDDQFRVMSGNDRIYGGDKPQVDSVDTSARVRFGDVTGGGWDTLDFFWTSTAIVSLSSGTYDITNGGGRGQGMFTGIETIWGSRGPDLITGKTANSASDALLGKGFGMGLWLRGGNDTVNLEPYGYQPWAEGSWISYDWSQTGIDLLATGPSSVRVIYRGTANQEPGTDQLSYVHSFDGTRFDDVFNLTALVYNHLGYYTRPATQSSWNLVNVSDGGNDKVIGNGQTILTIDPSESTNGKGIDFDLRQEVVDLSHLKSWGAALGQVTYSGVYYIQATKFDDTLRGGLAENDSFEGFRGGGGNDWIDGGSGYDRADYFASQSTYRIDVQLAQGIVKTYDSADTVLGFHGEDTLRSIEEIRGRNGNDIYDARGFSGVAGSSGNVSSFSWGLNQFYPEGGNDTIYGNGATRLSYREAMVGIEADLQAGFVDALVATDKLTDAYLTVGRDTIIGGGVYQVEGTALSDRLMGGGAGRTGLGATFLEQFIGNAGNDTIDGRGGWDVASYSTSPNAIKVDRTQTDWQVLNDGWSGKDSLLNVEGVIGSYFDDEYKGSNNPSQESFMGSRGADSIDGLGGYDEVEYGDDPGGVIVVLDKTFALTLTTPFSSTLSAHIGVGSGDAWQGFAIDGWGDKDLLRGVEGIEGSRFDDLFIGSELSNRFDGRAGADTIYGGAGNDWVEYNQNEAGVVVDLGLGKATEDGSGSIDTFFSIENIEGGMGSDRLKGDDGSNILFGHAGADTLEGADGADTLWGGAGGDLLIGGSGSDVFWIDGANESSLGGTQPPPWDVIQDFVSGADKVRIESLGSLALGSANSITITTPAFNLTDTTWDVVTEAITAAQVATTNPLPRSSGSSVNAYWLKFVNTDNSNPQFEAYGSFLWVDSGDASTNLIIQFVGVQSLISSDFVLGPPGGN